MNAHRLLCCFGILLPVMPLAAAEDWPQWGGPNRDFRVQAPALSTSWPSTGPRVLWSRPLGDGHSAVVVQGGMACTMYASDKREHILMVDAGTGDTLWEHAYAAKLKPSYPQYRGPHATPLMAEGRVFAVGIEARLHALERNTGRVLWQHDLVQSFGARLPQSGYAASPAIHGDTLLVPVGGANGRGFGAFDAASGRVKWLRHDLHVSHASPIVIRFAGRNVVVMNVVDALVGLDIATGDLLWRTALPQTMDNVAFTPLWDADAGRLTVSHYYDNNSGTRTIQLRKRDGGIAAEVVSTSRALRIEHTNGVFGRGMMFGSDGNGPFFFMAIDRHSGERLWRVRKPKANGLWVNDLLVLLDGDGVLSFNRPDRAGLGELSTARVLGPDAWTVPTLVGTTLYLRDARKLVALDLSVPASDVADD